MWDSINNKTYEFMSLDMILKDRRRRPEGRGEWESIKILLENLAYIPILDLTPLSSNSTKTAQL
jgi:hypothetical protein